MYSFLKIFCAIFNIKIRNNLFFFQLILIGFLFVILCIFNQYQKDHLVRKAFDVAKQAFDVILLGDSVFAYVNDHDEDQRSLVVMLNDKSQKNILDMTEPGISLMSQNQLLQMVDDLKIKTKCAILEINPLQSLKGFQCVNFNSLQAHFGMFLPLMFCVKDYLAYILYLNQKLSNGSAIQDVHTQDGQLNLQLFKDSLISSIELLQSVSHQIICFIPPVDLAYIREYYSDDDKIAFYEIKHICQILCENLGILFLDLYDGLPDSNYFPALPCYDGYRVHLNDKGRQWLCEKLTSVFDEK